MSSTPTSTWAQYVERLATLSRIRSTGFSPPCLRTAHCQQRSSATHPLRCATGCLHITVPSGRDILAFNAVYMRALRPVADQSSFSAHNELTDRQVRDKLQQPSIECIIAKQRLAYVGRLVRQRPRSLL
eukprot:2425716-Karenia_brevis.AAC.1